MRALIQRLVLVVLFGLLLSTTAAAQHHPTSTSRSARPLLGPQAGLATHDFDLFIGGQFAYPVAERFDVYPSLQIYFPSGGSAWGFFAAGRWWPPLNAKSSGLYVGGGLNYARASGGGASHSSSGLALLGGWDFKTVKARPFAELRIVVGGDYDRLDIGGGVNFKL